MSFNPANKSSEEVLQYLKQLLQQLENCRDTENSGNYRSYLHGQVYGAAVVLRLLFPGPGNLGEKAALMLRPVLTEHQCQCDD
ncbi:MAG: hypothetical protein MJA84_02115 [Firmicutes bacterium]|nr:hypothetical protein [Bacillota bacterium]